MFTGTRYHTTVLVNCEVKQHLPSRPQFSGGSLTSLRLTNACLPQYHHQVIFDNNNNYQSFVATSPGSSLLQATDTYSSSLFR